jgi:hypothetical protein
VFDSVVKERNAIMLLIIILVLVLVLFLGGGGFYRSRRG